MTETVFELAAGATASFAVAVVVLRAYLWWDGRR